MIAHICVERTLTGRLVQRFSKDLDQIDHHLPNSFITVISCFLSIAGALFTVSAATPLFIVFIIPILMIYSSITSFYRPVALSLKRLDSVSRSPIYQQFGETLAGIQVIRSFKKQAKFRLGNELAVENNFSAFFTLKALDRWLSVRLEGLGNILVLLSSLLAMASGSRGGPAGISLTTTLGITGLLNWAVRNVAEMESQMTSVERVLHTIESTPSESDNRKTLNEKRLEEITESELAKSGWPWNGEIVFSNVHMKYREDFESALRGVSVEVKSGERLAIVGRTGSGKSTLFRVLLRLNELEKGSILIDGQDISQINLNTLRSSVSIIPQDAVLFGGSIR